LRWGKRAPLSACCACGALEMGGVRQKEGGAITLLRLWHGQVLGEEFTLEWRVVRIVPEREEKRVRGKTV